MAYRCPPRPPYRCPVPKRRPGGTIPAPEAAPGKYPQQSTITGFTQNPGGGGTYVWPRFNTSVTLETVTISDLLIANLPPLTPDVVLTLLVQDGGMVVRYVAATNPVAGLFGSNVLYGNYVFAPSNIDSVRFYEGTQLFAGSFIVNVGLPNSVIVPANGLVTVQVSGVDFTGGNGQAGTAVMVFRDSRASTL